MYVQIHLSSERGGYKIAKNKDVTHRLTVYVWLLPIKAAKRIAYIGKTDPAYILPYASTGKNIEKEKNQIITKKTQWIKTEIEQTQKFQKTQKAECALCGSFSQIPFFIYHFHSATHSTRTKHK